MIRSGVNRPDRDGGIDLLFLSKNLGQVIPLLYPTWEQKQYYSRMCPPGGRSPGDRTVTGGVPVAMRQIMNYCRWPLTGIGSYV